MNFATCASLREAVRTAPPYVTFLASVLAAVGLGGCGDAVREPSPQQLQAFEEAGAAQPTVDMDSIQRARLYAGPYRVVPGDVLEFTMPALLQMVSAAELKAAQTQPKEEQPYICRVSPGGTITLPAAGEMEVAGLSLAEIEAKVVNAYRRYVVLRPSVFVRVLEYKTSRVSITGAVAKPGVYALRSDQLFLATLLMESGGIVKEGAATIRIGRLPRGQPQPFQAEARPPEASPSLLGGAGTSAAPATPVSWQRPRAAGAWRAVFQREGPLRTTGWLALEGPQGARGRRWLDLGNEWQRQAFLQAAAASSPPVTTDGLRAALVQLAVYLESRSGNATAGGVPPDWEAVEENQFVARLAEPLTNVDPDPLPRRVSRTNASGATDEDEITTLVLPVRGFNIPFRDVALQEGDTVVVEQMQVPLFCVLGLVNHPGNYPYPPMAQYTVAQAIGFAGGLDPVTEPRYVTVYRLTKDGSIARVPLKLVEDGGFTSVLGTPIRPGDVIAVEHTPRTRMNTVVNSLLRVNTGVYITGTDLWGRY